MKTATLAIIGWNWVTTCFFFCILLVTCGCSACSNWASTVGQSGSLTYLKEEFEKVPALPNSTVRHPTRASVRGWHGSVEIDYSSNASSDEIKVHYQKVLLSRGWSFCREEKVIYRNQDYGGEHVFFRKEIYTADLQLAGRQESQFGWTYAFSMSWGIFDDVQCH